MIGGLLTIGDGFAVNAIKAQAKPRPGSRTVPAAAAAVTEQEEFLLECQRMKLVYVEVYLWRDKNQTGRTSLNLGQTDTYCTWGGSTELEPHSHTVTDPPGSGHGDWCIGVIGVSQQSLLNRALDYTWRWFKFYLTWSWRFPWLEDCRPTYQLLLFMMKSQKYDPEEVITITFQIWFRYYSQRWKHWRIEDLESSWNRFLKGSMLTI